MTSQRPMVSPDDDDRADRAPEPALARCFSDDERGTVFAEYVTLLVFISLGCVTATVALGIPLTELFLFQRAILLLPIP